MDIPYSSVKKSAGFRPNLHDNLPAKAFIFLNSKGWTDRSRLNFLSRGINVFQFQSRVNLFT